MAGEKIIDGVSSKENVSDKHEWVKEQVKTELTDLKMDVLGFYEPDSANPEKIKYNLEAVKQYLGELCKSVEGKSDKEAWQYLKEKASRSYAWIMAVQVALESLGEGWDTDVNKIDGLLGGAGSHTRTAVRKFQDKWNENHEDKLNPDGLPGRATIKALLEAMGGSVSTKVETDKDKIEKVLLYEEVPVVKGEEITVDKLIKENPGGVEVKIAEGQDLSTAEVGEKTVTVELKSGEETDKKEVKVKVVEQTEIDKYKLDRVVLHEEVSIVKGEEITVDKLIKENPDGVEVKIVEGQDLTTNEVGEKIIKVELKSGEETDIREVKVKIEEKVVEIAQNDDLDNIQLSDLGKWEGGEFKFNDGMLDEETGDLTINDKVFKKLEEGSDGFGYVKKEGLLSIGNFRGGFLNGKGVEFDDYGNEYRGEWKDGLLYNGVHVSEVEDVKFFYEVKEGKSVKCYVDDTLSIDMEKIGENVYLKYGENSLKLKNPYSAQVILKMLWDYKDKEGEFVSDFQQPNKLFRKGKDGNKKVVYNTVDGLIDSAVVPGGILAGWLNDYRHSENEKIEDATRVKVEGVGKFVENQFVFNAGVEKEENGKKYIEFGGKKYYECKEGINGLGYKAGINNDKIGWLYMGEYVNGKKEGKGTYTWADGDKYEGEWKDGNREGKGTYIIAGGDKYEGEWKGNIFEGGRTTWANGNKFEGEYKNNKMEKGKFTIVIPEEIAGEYEVERDEKGIKIVSEGENKGKYLDAVNWKIVEKGEKKNEVKKEECAEVKTENGNIVKGVYYKEETKTYYKEVEGKLEEIKSKTGKPIECFYITGDHSEKGKNRYGRISETYVDINDKIVNIREFDSHGNLFKFSMYDDAGKLDYTNSFKDGILTQQRDHKQGKTLKLEMVKDLGDDKYVLNLDEYYVLYKKNHDTFEYQCDKDGNKIG